jgi:hypothetical protein
MDVEVTMWMWEENKSKGTTSFPLLAFYAGKIRHKVKDANYWAEFLDDQSLLPVAHIMELAYQLNNLVIFKKPDLSSQNLIDARVGQKRLQGKIDVHIKNPNAARLWQGSYNFGFKVEQMLSNNVDEDGNRWDTALLKIIDRSERMRFPTA